MSGGQHSQDNRHVSGGQHSQDEGTTDKCQVDNTHRTTRGEQTGVRWTTPAGQREDNRQVSGRQHSQDNEEDRQVSGGQHSQDNERTTDGCQVDNTHRTTRGQQTSVR